MPTMNIMENSWWVLEMTNSPVTDCGTISVTEQDVEDYKETMKRFLSWQERLKIANGSDVA